MLGSKREIKYPQGERNVLLQQWWQITALRHNTSGPLFSLSLSLSNKNSHVSQDWKQLAFYKWTHTSPSFYELIFLNSHRDFVLNFIVSTLQMMNLGLRNVENVDMSGTYQLLNIT